MQDFELFALTIREISRNASFLALSDLAQMHARLHALHADATRDASRVERDLAQRKISRTFLARGHQALHRRLSPPLR